MAMFEDFKKHILTVLGVIACVFHVVMIPVLLRLFFAGALRFDNTIFFISISSIIIVLLSCPYSMTKTREILTFLFSETAIFGGLTLNLLWLFGNVSPRPVVIENKYFCSGVTAVLIYTLVIFPIMVCALHSIYICHFLRDTLSSGVRINAVVRAIYCIIGSIVLHSTLFTALLLPIKLLDLSFILIIAQLYSIFTVNLTTTELDRGNITKTVDRWTHLQTHFRYYRKVTLIPLIGSIIIVAVKSICWYLEKEPTTVALKKDNVMLEMFQQAIAIVTRLPKSSQDADEYEFMARSLTASLAIVFSVFRYLYLQGVAAFRVVNIGRLLSQN